MTQMRELEDHEKIIGPHRVKCQSHPAFDSKQKACNRVATHAVNDRSYCKDCANNIMNDIKMEAAKHKAFVAEGYIELPKPPKYPHFPEHRTTQRIPYTNRCRVKSEKWNFDPNHGKHTVATEPCGEYIPDNWPMCESHQERRWGFETVYNHDDYDGGESGFSKQQVLWLLRQMTKEESRD